MYTICKFQVKAGEDVCTFSTLEWISTAVSWFGFNCSSKHADVITARYISDSTVPFQVNEILPVLSSAVGK